MESIRELVLSRAGLMDGGHQPKEICDILSVSRANLTTFLSSLMSHLGRGWVCTFYPLHTYARVAHEHCRCADAVDGFV